MVKTKLYRQNHTKATASILGWLSIQVFQKCRVHHIDCGDLFSCSLWLLGEVSLSLLCSHRFWGSALDLALPLRVGRLRASVLRSDRMGLKQQLIRGLWLTQAGEREGYGMWVSLQWQRPAWRCDSLSHPTCSSGEVVPGSWDPGSGRLHSLLGREVWIVTCACTQASWWLQQQP